MGFTCRFDKETGLTEVYQTFPEMPLWVLLSTHETSKKAVDKQTEYFHNYYLQNRARVQKQKKYKAKPEDKDLL